MKQISRKEGQEWFGNGRIRNYSSSEVSAIKLEVDIIILLCNITTYQGKRWE